MTSNVLKPNLNKPPWLLCANRDTRWVNYDSLWLHKPHSKWTTFVARKNEIHSLHAIALSRCSQTMIPPASFFPHMNLLPTNPNPQKHNHPIHHESLAFVLPASFYPLATPSFSSDFRISLKSPTHNHGSDASWFKFFRSYHDIWWLWVLGAP